MNGLEPDTAVEQYLESRVDAAPTTVDKHEYRLRKFLAFTEEQDLDDMTELAGKHVEQFRQDRLADDATNLVTTEQCLHTFRVFLRYCERIEAVDQGLADKVIIPNVSSQQKAREVHLSHERAEQITDYLCKYEWASIQHIVWHLTYHTGMRRSALYALDKGDWRSDERVLLVRHRDNTPLKLREEGERNLSITDDRLASAIDDYLADVRPDVEDEWGREPFFASEQGRYHYQSLQKVFYKVTRPCYFADTCPMDRDMDECEGTEYGGYSKCPESVSSHPIRRSAIHHHLNEGVPKTVCSERMAVSESTLTQHYDARDEEEKRQARQDFLDSV